MISPGARFYEFGPFRLLPEHRLLQRDSEVIHLSPKAFEILAALVENAGCLLTKEVLMNRIWPDVHVDENNLPRTISTLRRALSVGPPSERLIATVPKLGYRFTGKVRLRREALADPLQMIDGQLQPAASALPFHSHLLPRTREAQAVVDTIAQNPVTTIVAPPGFGKTSLASLVAAGIAREFRDGAWFVPLELLPDLGDERDVIRAVAAVFGETADHDTLPALTRLFARKNLLLVLDACEGVLDACEAVVSALMLACPGVKLLATSRRALSVSGERVWRLPSLDLPDEHCDDWEVLDRFLCAQLFARTAENIGHPLSRNADTARAVATLCWLTEGIPLAIELAASLTPVQSLTEIIESIRHDLRLDGSHEQKINRRIARSYRHLPLSATLLLPRLAAFADTWSEESAVSVCADPALPAALIPGVLKTLAESGLISRSGPGGRYRMLAMVRAFASARLAGRADFSQAHFNHFRDLSGRAASQVLGADVLSSLDILENEWTNVLKALDWSVNRCPLEGLAFCASLYPFWVVTGRLTEGRERLKTFLAKAADCPERVQLLTWQGLGLLAYHQSDYGEGLECCYRALTLARPLGELWICSLMLMAVGNMRLHHRAEYEGALADFDESLSLAKRIDDPWLLALAMGNHAMQRAHIALEARRAVSSAEADEILRDSANSVRLARKTGNPWIIALSLMNRVLPVRFFQRDPDVAEGLVQEALALRCRIREKYGIIQCLYKLAAVACERRSPEQYRRAAVLLGGLNNLVGGRERIPIPRLNKLDFERTLEFCRRQLGEADYTRCLEMGRSLPTADLMAFAQSAATDPRMIFEPKNFRSAQ